MSESHAPASAALLLVALAAVVAAQRGHGARPQLPTPALRPAPGAPAAAAFLFAARLDLDAIDAAALEAVPTFGPARAARVLEARAARAGHVTLAELAATPGLGASIAKRLAAYVFASDGASVSASVSVSARDAAAESDAARVTRSPPARAGSARSAR